MRRIFILFLILVFIFSYFEEGFAYYMAPNIICETGIKLYKQKKYDEALLEFKKVLLINSNHRLALEYIQKILTEKQRNWPKPPSKGKAPAIKSFPKVYPHVITPKSKMSIQPVSEIKSLQSELPDIQAPLTIKLEKEPKAQISKFIQKVQVPIIKLTDYISKLQPDVINVELDKSVILECSYIDKFLATQEGVLLVERADSMRIIISGNKLGYSYLHVWTDKDRFKLSFLVVPAKQSAESLEDLNRQKALAADDFKLSYSMDWSSYESGRRISSLERSIYSYVHNLKLTGPTPYGKLDSSLTANIFNKDTKLSRYTIGLTDGQFGEFKDFTLRAFDFFDTPPDFSNISFPGTSLRGFMVESLAFDKKIDYTVFSGRENKFPFGNLSPELNKEQDSFIDGANFNYRPFKDSELGLTILQGRGDDRVETASSDGYDFNMKQKIYNWILKYELASDSKNEANLIKGDYNDQRLDFTTELRDIPKDFKSVVGSPSRQGERGAQVDANYKITDKTDTRINLDVFQDRLYPNPDDQNRLNEDLNWSLNHRIDEDTSLRLNYILQNELGRLSKLRYQDTDIGFTKAFRLIMPLNVYANFYHQENNNFTSTTSDYINNKIYAGLRLNLSNDLYYFMSEELNWLKESYYNNRSRPSAFETGLEWSSRIPKSPLFATARITYHDEEHTNSNLSFLSGEDYLEGYSELTYRPNPDFEMYGSCRMLNVWADNDSVSKRIEANFNGGLRLFWGTGLSWQPQGNIEGYAFKDYNSDGIMQRDEPPVAGIKVNLNKDKFVKTDRFGYYKFTKVRAQEVYLNLDIQTIPSGFVLTTSPGVEVKIEQSRTKRVDFGIVSRSEISGYVFLDRDMDGEFAAEDYPIKGAVLILEDGSKCISDASGRYSFSKVSVGEHILTLDLNSIPVSYLPKAPLSKKITLFEGVTYQNNIALIEKKD